MQSFLLLSLFYLQQVCAQSWTIGQEVNTTSGLVKGHASKAAPQVSEYLGIKFGEGTTGQNRFMAPKPFRSNTNIDAAKFGAGCPMGGAGGILGAASGLAGTIIPLTGGAAPSEDCLFVNVWTKPQGGEKKKAVMVWIYGGGFSMGDTSTYDGSTLADNQDVVVASMNYRTNIFGFPAAPDLPNQNLAFLDQRLAVQWVHDNIEAFGGDPNRITIFGESAGGSSVDYYAYMWQDDPLIQGIISQSGTAQISGPFASPPTETRHAYWFNMSSKLGCGGPEAGGPATVKCAQSKSVQNIVDAMPKADGVQAIVGFYGPMVDEKLIFSFEEYAQKAAAGKFIQKPLLIGSNNNESNLFALLSLGSAKQEQLDGIDKGFRCGAKLAAEGRRANKVPVWRYHYAGTKAGDTRGATHAQDITQVFGDGKKGLSKTFQDAWGAFARDPVNGLNKIGWPAYNPNANTLVRLGYNDAVMPDFVYAGTYDGICEK